MCAWVERVGEKEGEEEIEVEGGSNRLNLMDLKVRDAVSKW